MNVEKGTMKKLDRKKRANIGHHEGRRLGFERVEAVDE